MLCKFIFYRIQRPDSKTIFFSNDVNVEGATHRQVVELIKASDQVLKLTVISIAPEVAEKLENNGKYKFVQISFQNSSV